MQELSNKNLIQQRESLFNNRLLFLVVITCDQPHRFNRLRSTSVIDSGDSKYIEGNQPSQLSKAMNNIELTFDEELSLKELEDINGAFWGWLIDFSTILVKRLRQCM